MPRNWFIYYENVHKDIYGFNTRLVSINLSHRRRSVKCKTYVHHIALNFRLTYYNIRIHIHIFMLELTTVKEYVYKTSNVSFRWNTSHLGLSLGHQRINIWTSSATENHLWGQMFSRTSLDSS